MNHLVVNAFADELEKVAALSPAAKAARAALLGLGLGGGGYLAAERAIPKMYPTTGGHQLGPPKKPEPKPKKRAKLKIKKAKKPMVAANVPRGPQSRIDKAMRDKGVAESTGLLADLAEMGGTGLFSDARLDPSIASASGRLTGSTLPSYASLGSRGFGVAHSGGKPATLADAGTRGTEPGDRRYGKTPKAVAQSK